MDITDLPERIAAKLTMSPEGCWLWTAASDTHGYGKMRWDGKLHSAHRLIYQLLVGDPGPELDHLCRVPPCCNPAHLEPVTHAENVRRGRAGMNNKVFWALPRDCPHGHRLEGDNVYTHITKKGAVNNQCRTCRRGGKRRRRAAGARD